MTEAVNRHHRRNPEALPLAYGMAEAAALAGLSRSHLYAEAAAGRLVTRKVGRRRIVLAPDLGAYLDALPTS
jgi:hypothetical protein